MSEKTRRFFFITLAALTLTLVSCNASGSSSSSSMQSSPTSETSAGAEQKEKKADLKEVSLTFSSGSLDIIILPYAAAQYLGYFEEEGLKVNFIVSSGGGGQTAQVLATGATEYGNLVFDPVLNAYANGKDMGIIGIWNQGYGSIFNQALVLDKSPIQDYQDLEGKIIGTLGVAESSLAYPRQALKEAGVDPATVTFIAVGVGPSAINALKSGEIDALWQWHTAHANVQLTLEEEGIQTRLLPSVPLSGQLLNAIVATTKKYYEQNAEEVAKFGRALSKGSAFTYANPEAAIQMLWAISPETKPKANNDDEAMQKALFVWNSVSASQYKVGEKWGEFLPEAWEKNVQFLGFSDRINDPSIFYTNELLDEMNNFDEEEITSFAKGYTFK